MHLETILQHGKSRLKPWLLDQMRERIRMRHYSSPTEEAYVDWIRRFVLFQGKRHPVDLGKERAPVPLPGSAGDRIAVAG